MTVKELIETLSEFKPNNRVVIKRRGESIGPQRASLVIGAHAGFDWDNDLVFLDIVNNKMIEK